MLATVRWSDLGIADLPFHYLGNDYLGKQETKYVVGLVASVAPRVVFEFGTNQGKTAAAILKACPTIETFIGIDAPAGYRTTLEHQQSEVPRDPGHAAAADPRFFLLRADSSTLTADDLEEADAIFIDGDHSRNGVLNDSHLAAQVLRSPGVIVWHDYGNVDVGVTEALDHLVASEGWPILHITQTWLAFCRRT